jgi:hypothetical protein
MTHQDDLAALLPDRWQPAIAATTSPGSVTVMAAEHAA